MAETVIYECSECGANDSDRGINDRAPLALVCWRCSAGSKMSVNDQLSRQIGMIQKQKG